MNCLSHFVTLAQWLLTLISSVNLQWCVVTWPCDIAISNGRPWRVHHSLMTNVTWWRFNQSAKRLAVGHMVTCLFVRGVCSCRWSLTCATRRWRPVTGRRSRLSWRRSSPSKNLWRSAALSRSMHSTSLRTSRRSRARPALRLDWSPYWRRSVDSRFRPGCTVSGFSVLSTEV